MKAEQPYHLGALYRLRESFSPGGWESPCDSGRTFLGMYAGRKDNQLTFREVTGKGPATMAYPEGAITDRVEVQRPTDVRYPQDSKSYTPGDVYTLKGLQKNQAGTFGAAPIPFHNTGIVQSVEEGAIYLTQMKSGDDPLVGGPSGKRIEVDDIVSATHVPFATVQTVEELTDLLTQSVQDSPEAQRPSA